MILAAKALAFVRGRDYALPEDVRDLALDVLRHRLVLSYEALADDVTADDVLGAGRWPPCRCPRCRSDERPSPDRRSLVSRIRRRLSASCAASSGRSSVASTAACRATTARCSAASASTSPTCATYEPGDDVRHIDWNVTARMDAPFVRKYPEDRELTAWLLLDRSPSMGFGPTERPKELVLTELAATLARLLTRGGNRVGAILYDNAVERTIPPRTGRNQVLRLDAASCCGPAEPTGHGHRPRPASSTPAPRTIKRRSLVIAHLRLHQRARLGAAAGAAEPAPRGGRHPPRRSARARAARRRRDRRRGRRDRRAALGRHERSRVPPPLPRRWPRPRAGRAAGGGPARRRRPPRRLDRRRPRRRARADRRAAGGGGGADVVRLAADAGAARWLVPLLVVGYVALVAAARRGARPSWPRRASCPTAAAPRRAGARHVPFALLPRRRHRCCSFALARPQTTLEHAAPRGHRDPRLRRVQQHGRRRPRADPAGRGEGGGPARSSTSSRRRSRSASSPSATAALVTQQPTTVTGRRAGGDRPADAAGWHLARPGHLRLAQRDRRQAGRARPTSDARQPTSTTSTSATSARRPIVLLSDGENTGEPDPLDVAKLASVAGVHIYPIGIGSPDGHGRRRSTASGGDRARRATLLTSIASVTDGTYFHAERRRGAGRRLQARIDLQCHDETETDRGHGRSSPASARCCSWSAARCRCSGSGGWCSRCRSPGRSPCSLLLVVPLLLGAYLWQLRRRRKQRRALLERRPDPRGDPEALALAAARAGRAVPRQPRRRWPSPAPGPQVAVDGAARAHVDHPGPRRVPLDVLDRRRSRTGSTVAQEAARAFVARPGGRHADRHRRLLRASPSWSSPPTTDKQKLIDAIDSLTTARGTAIGAAILKALDAIAEVTRTCRRSAPNVDAADPGDGAAVDAAGDRRAGATGTAATCPTSSWC